MNLSSTVIMLFQLITQNTSEKYLEKNSSGRLLNRKQLMNLGRQFKRHLWSQ